MLPCRRRPVLSIGRGQDFGPAGFRGDFGGALVCPGSAACFVTAALVSTAVTASTLRNARGGGGYM